jgi:hypothetical protein
MNLDAHRTLTPAVQPVLDTSAYGAGDLAGTLLTFTVPPAYLGGFRLEAVTITDLDKQSAALDLVFFSAGLVNSTLTDNAAFDPHDTDLLTYLGHVSVPAANYTAFNDSSAATLKDIALAINPPGTGLLYAVLVSRGTPTYAASSLRVALTIARG